MINPRHLVPFLLAAITPVSAKADTTSVFDNALENCIRFAAAQDNDTLELDSSSPHYTYGGRKQVDNSEIIVLDLEYFAMGGNADKMEGWACKMIPIQPSNWEGVEKYMSPENQPYQLIDSQHTEQYTRWKYLL